MRYRNPTLSVLEVRRHADKIFQNSGKSSYKAFYLCA